MVCLIKNVLPKLQTILRHTFCEVVEDLAFMFAEPANLSELVLPADAVFLQAAINYECRDIGVRGNINILCTRALCRKLVINITGFEKADDLFGKESDVLKELLNIGCGKFLTERHGMEEIFVLSVPVMSHANCTEWKKLFREDISAILLIDDVEPMIICVSEVS